MKQGRELAMQLRRAYLTMHRKANAQFIGHGASADQFVLLSLLSEEDGITQKDLVDRSSSDPNTVRAMLVLMERRGWVRRAPHSTDGRAISVTLTPKGRRFQRELAEAGEPFHTSFLGLFSPRECESLMASLGRIADGLPAPARRQRTPAGEGL